MTLSDREVTALRNLADKKAGRDVDWINIADARSLTEQGLARRSGGGWEITSEGLARLAAIRPDGAGDAPPPATIVRPTPWIGGE